MKTGIIVYTTGQPPPDWTEGSEQGVRALFPNADAVEIITAKAGHFDVHDAWYNLITGGVSLVLCKMAAFNKASQLRFAARELRLCD